MSLVCRQDAWNPWSLLEGFWSPALDVKEGKDAFTVKADLPGLKQEDLTVTVLGTTLTIEGQRKQETEDKAEDGQYHRIERTYGTFQRVLELPAEVQAEAVKATYRDGVLTLTIPKQEAAKPKAVKVDVN